MVYEVARAKDLEATTESNRAANAPPEIDRRPWMVAYAG